MKKKSALKKNEFQAFSYLKIFALIITSIVVFTFILRTLTQIKESSFNKPYYTILLIDNFTHIINIDLKKKTILILEPQKLKVNANMTTLQSISFNLGIPIDSIIRIKNPKRSQNLSREFKSLPFVISFFTSPRYYSLTNMNKIDIIKIFIVSNFATDKITTIALSDILGASTESQGNTIKNESILNKNRTLEIINASSFDGIASQMSKMFNNIGYTTVAERTSITPQKAKIIYRIEKDDTVDTIINLLKMPSTFDPNIGIADISIIVDETYAKQYLKLTNDD